MHIAGNKNTSGSAIIDETNKQLFNCVDMNKDGKLSVSDVTALQIYIQTITKNNNYKKKGSYRKVKCDSLVSFIRSYPNICCNIYYDSANWR